MSSKWYLKIAKLMKTLNVDFVVDINDEILKDILKYKPLLVKPNEDEIRNIFNHQGYLSKSDLVYYGKKLQALGARYVIISLGEKGSMFFNKNQVYTSKNLNCEVISTVGAGDSMVAGFIAEYRKSQDALLAYKMAKPVAMRPHFQKKLQTRP